MHGGFVPYVGPKDLRALRSGAQSIDTAVENGQPVPEGDRPLGCSGAEDAGAADEQDPQGGVAGEGCQGGIGSGHHA